MKQFFKKHTDKKPPTLIVKPSDQCQGKGIFFTNEFDKIAELLTNQEKPQKFVCQKYVAKPYLIDGLKFDLRLYVVVTSAAPLTIFIHDDGLARFATQAYEKPGESANGMASCAHLTNYAINKDNTDFKLSKKDIEDGISSKRTLEHVWKRLAAEKVDV